MSLRPTSVEVTVERQAPASDDQAGRTLRLTARLEPGPSDGLPTAEELHEAIQNLTDRLDAALELSGGVRGTDRGPERELDELIETYRPRQVELVELLRADGELSTREASLLRRHMESRAVPTGAAPSEPRVTPAGTSREPGSERTVEELIAAYQIASLKQAGAVRARRQISFAEYMALKRHFSALESPEVVGPAPP